MCVKFSVRTETILSKLLTVPTFVTKKEIFVLGWFFSSDNF